MTFINKGPYAYNIIISILCLTVISLLAIKYCSVKKIYTQAQLDAIHRSDSLKQKAFADSLNFLRRQIDSQQEKNALQQFIVLTLEQQIDRIKSKHLVTKQEVKQYQSDTGFVLAPNEYVNECEGCFDLLGKYKKENVQLRFERDSYDTLMRNQTALQDGRITNLEWEKAKLQVLLSQQKATERPCDTTWKIKASVIGMFSNPFLPKGGGFGLIYEDKHFNEYGAHVIFTNSNNIYLFNIAKTISFRRKK